MRRNLWKKVTSATLCAAMVGGIMVSNGALAVQAEDGEEKEVITLRVMGETGMDGISTDDAVGRYIKEKLGIVLEYTNVSTDRLKVMASGGDLPDIVELHGDDVNVSTLIDAGSLWAMDDWLEENGDNLKEKIPTALRYAKEVVGNGKTYFVPTNVQTANPDLPNKNGFVGFYTRWDYYKELGYPDVSTEDKYLDVLKQMVDAHPTTEDGKKVYALSGWTDWDIFPYKISYPFDMGYTNQDNNQLLNDATGEIEDMFTVEDGPLWKSLAFYNKAYRMGIMDPEAFTMKNDQYNAKIKNGEVLVSNYNWCGPDASVCGDDAAMYMIPGTFPYAMQIYPTANPLGYTTSNALVISANCEYPERAMELIDYLASDEGARLVRTGVPGEDWDVVDGEPELIGKRLENFTSNDKEYSGYTSDGVQGIGKYKWLSPLWETNQCADGEPVDLTLSKKYILSTVTDIDKDFCDYYTDGKAQYPGEVYVELVEEGKLKTNNEDSTGSMTASLMKPVSDESARVFSKAMEYFQANIAKVITCADDDAFEEQKQKMISDVMAMGYESALEEVQANFEEAKNVVDSFK